MEWIKKNATLLVAGMLLFHFVLSLNISRQESMTYDEKAHIPAAYSYVRYGDMRLNPEHPPLLKDLAGIFLLPLKLQFPLASTEWQEGANEQWAVGDMFVNCTRPELACNDADTILFYARLPITLIAMLLGVVLFLWARELGGALAGVLAVALYAFDPNMIAHSHYVTTDIGSATFIFIAFYFFLRFLKNPSRTNILAAGLFLGLAELAKFSAVLVFPVFGLFVLLYALTKIPPQHELSSAQPSVLKTLFSYSWKFLAVLAVCFTVTWALYAVNTLGMPATKVAAHADLFLSQPNAPARFTHDLIVRMSGSPFLLPFAEYFVGIAKVFSRVAAGNVHYFLGTVSVDASPAYFPVIFTLKETLPFLFLLLLTTGYGFYRSGRQYTQEKTLSCSRFLAHSFQNNTTQYLGVFFVLFYSYISITGNLNIGLRHLFPIMPFLYLLIGKTLADFYKRHQAEPVTQKLVAYIYGAVFCVILAIPVLSYPYYLSYFNPVGGGHRNGYLYATDSNYDWGQDLKHLKNWISEYNVCVGQITKSPACLALITSTHRDLTAQYPTWSPIDQVRVDYFGGSDPHYYLGDRFIPWWGSRRPVEPGWYAICTFFYQESLYKTLAPGEHNYAWLKDQTPLARAGDSFLIYYFSPADIATLNQESTNDLLPGQ